MKKIAFIILLMLASAAYGQYPDFKSVSSLEHTNSIFFTSTGKAVKVDHLGNKILAGEYNGTVDFDFTSGVTTNTAIGGSCFVSKYDDLGNILWVKTISSSVGVSSVQDMEIDSLGNIYLCGFFDGTIDFDPGPGTANNTSIASGSGQGYNGYVMKLNSNGLFEWGQGLNASSESKCWDLILDDSANVYTVGYFVGTMDADASSGTSSLVSYGAPNAFLQKLDKDGGFVWAHALNTTNTSQTYYTSIAINTDQDLVLCGRASGYYVDFDPGAGSVVLPFSDDAFVLKLTKNNQFVWVKGFNGYFSGATSFPHQVITDAQNNIYYAGRYGNVIDFDPDPNNTFYLPYLASYDIFVVKLDVLGNFTWAKSLGTDDNDGTTCMNIDENANIYIGLRIEGDGDLNPGTDTAFVSTVGGVDGCLVSLNSSGDFRWVYQLSGAAQYWGEMIHDIALNNDSTLLITGFYADTVDFDNGPGVSELGLPINSAETYLANIDRCVVVSDTITGTACGEYISPITFKTYFSSGIYEDTTFYNLQGCGFSYVLNLEIDQIDVSTTTNFNQMSANNSAQSYQWIDCATMTAILGENNQSYTALSNGEYAVIIDDGNCIDTSDCILVSGLGLDGNEKYKLSVTPNPASNTLLISLNYDANATLEIYSVGQELLRSQNMLSQTKIDITTLSRGIYFVVLKSKDFNIVRKFIKE